MVILKIFPLVNILAKVVFKKIDKLGRIVIPKEWRKKLGKTVVLVWEDPIIKIVPLKDFRLSDLFDSIEFSGDIEDWLDVKKMKGRILDEIFGF